MKKLVRAAGIVLLFGMLLGTFGCQGNVYVGVSTWGPYGVGYPGSFYPVPAGAGVVYGRPIYP